MYDKIASATGDASKTLAVAGGALLRPSSAPWADATVTGLSHSSGAVTGGTVVTITGSNFADSPYLKVFFGETAVTPQEVVDKTKLVVVAPAAPVGCGDVVSVAVANSGLAPTASGLAYTFEATVSDLGAGLARYYSMDIPDGTMGVVKDSVGSKDGSVGSSTVVTVDRDGFENAAVSLGAGKVVWPPYVAAGDSTVCAWVMIHAALKLQKAPNLYLGWKQVCHVRKGAADAAYVNGDPADKEESAIISAIAAELVSGEVSGTYVKLLDDVWIWGRALGGCELKARFYTAEYALDLQGTAMTVANGSQPPSPYGMFEAWIYPTSYGGDMTIVESEGGGLTLSMKEGKLTLSLSQPCPGSSTECTREHASWKAVPPLGQWSHVAASYDGTTMFFYIDGILLDKALFTSNLQSTGTGNLKIGENFHGKIFDLQHFGFADTQGALASFEVKHGIQCRPKDQLLNGKASAYFGFNEGAGDSTRAYAPAAPGPGSAIGALVSTPAPAWVNATHDEPTYTPSTTIHGAGMAGAFSDEVGLFTVTSHTACNLKRKAGGDAISVTMQGTDVFVPTVTDTNDGNYHVSYSGFACGLYTTTVMSGETVLSTFATEVKHGITDALSTTVDIPEGQQCSGTPNTFKLFTYDKAGCKTSNGDTFTVTLKGPMDLAATVSHVQDNEYEVKYDPPAAGTYFVEIALDGPDGPELISDAHHCIDVCAGGSMKFTGADYVEMHEANAGVTALDLSSEGAAMEALVQLTLPPPADSVAEGEAAPDAYLVYKGSAAEIAAGVFSKGYYLKLSPDYRTLTAAVYPGLGVERVVSYTLPEDATMSSEDWYHFAASYDGTTFVLYQGGNVLTSRTFATKLAVANYPNPYDHPLTIGHGFAGLIDEVKVWTTACTAAEITRRAFCPPFAELEKVGGYVSFNAAAYGPGSPVVGYSADGTLLGTAVGEGIGIGNLTAMTTLGNGFGVGHPGAYDSIRIPATAYGGMNEIAVEAKDQCGFVYQGGAAAAFTVTRKAIGEQYISPDLPGTEYPIPTEGPTEAYTATWDGTKTTCQTESKAPPYVPGNAYTQPVLFPAPGKYVVNAYGANMAGVQEQAIHGPADVAVQAGAPVKMEIMGQDEVATGVPSRLIGVLVDEMGNAIKVEHPVEVDITLVGQAYSAGIKPTVTFVTDGDLLEGGGDGYYVIEFTVGRAAQTGIYTIAVNVAGRRVATGGTSFFKGLPPQWRKVLTEDDAVPQTTMRYEHTAIVWQNDLYTFGGASYDKTYLNDMHVLRGADGFAGKDNFAYVRVIGALPMGCTAAGGADQLAGEEHVLEVTIDTAALVADGKILPSCTDIIFTLPGNGAALDYFLDPSPGCGSAKSLFYVKVPGSALKCAAGEQAMAPMAEMYFGNPAIQSNAYNTAAVLAFYEDFEGPALAQWAEVDPCSQAPTGSQGASFEVSSAFSYRGKQALHAKHSQKGMLKATLAAALEGDFVLKAWFWDSDAVDSAHFISPDYATCTSGDGKTFQPVGGPLEGVYTAVGTYGLSHKTKMCVASPWQSVAVPRSATWKELVVTGSTGPAGDQTVEISVGGVSAKVIHAAGGVTADRVVIAAGLSAYANDHAEGLEASHAFWDEIRVYRRFNGRAAAMGASATPVAKVEYPRKWEPVATNAPPPPRYSHTMVGVGDSMYIFGGERASFAFGDVWAFDFPTKTWSFVKPTSAASPTARYDHSAAVLGSSMVVFGGRNGNTILGDMWELDLAASKWTKLADAAPMGARFGHSAAAVDGRMYVFGGYTATGFSAEFFRCSPAADGGLACADITHGCPEAPMSAATPAKVGLTPRYGHVSFGAEGFVVVHGGTSLASKDGFGGVFAFATEACEWEKVVQDASEGATPPVERYEHAAAPVTGGFLVQGGHHSGSYKQDTMFFPL